MKTDRITRVNELLRRELGQTLYRVIHEGDINLARVTITHVITSPNLRSARVLVSVMGDEAEKKRVMKVLKKHRADMQREIGKNIGLKYTPKLSFHSDSSLKEGAEILTLLSELDDQAEEAKEQ